MSREPKRKRRARESQLRFSFPVKITWRRVTFFDLAVPSSLVRHMSVHGKQKPMITKLSASDQTKPEVGSALIIAAPTK